MLYIFIRVYTNVSEYTYVDIVPWIKNPWIKNPWIIPSLHPRSGSQDSKVSRGTASVDLVAVAPVAPVAP